MKPQREHLKMCRCGHSERRHGNDSCEGYVMRCPCVLFREVLPFYPTEWVEGARVKVSHLKGDRIKVMFEVCKDFVLYGTVVHAYPEDDVWEIKFDPSNRLHKFFDGMYTSDMIQEEGFVVVKIARIK